MWKMMLDGYLCAMIWLDADVDTLYVKKSSHYVEHNGENRILNRYHMREINHFKVLLLCKMMWKMMSDRCWCGMIWLHADVDTLHVKRISLNDP
jgi:hypothetical protein